MLWGPAPDPQHVPEGLAAGLVTAEAEPPPVLERFVRHECPVCAAMTSGTAVSPQQRKQRDLRRD